MIAPWIIVLVLMGFALFALGIHALRRRSMPGASSFGLLMFAAAIWSLAYPFELLAETLSAKMWWVRAEYVGISAIPILWLAFVLQYTGRGRWLSRRNTALLAAVPVLTILAVWSDPAHHLFYRLSQLDWSSGRPLLDLEYGPLFWLHTVFSYLCLALGTALLAAAHFRSSPHCRNQSRVLLLGALIPWAGNVVYLLGLSPAPDLDLVPLSSGLAALVLAYGLFRIRALEIVPVAWKAVVEGLPAAVIVLDPSNRIAALNPAAEKLFGVAHQDAVGRPAAQVLQPSELVARFAAMAEVDEPLQWGDGHERRVYQVAITPLEEGTDSPPPRLVLISDITAQANTADDLARRNQHLALLHRIASVAASTLDLQTLYQRLADTLAQIIGGDGCYITRIDPETGQGTGCAACGPFRDSYQGLHPPPGELTLTRSVLEAGRPLPVEDVFHSPYVSARIAEMFPARSQLGVPMRVGDRNLGAVLIAFNEPHRFSEEEIAWATQAVDLAALAIENARLFQIVERGKQEWEATFDAMSDLVAILDREHRIVRANRAMAARAGLTPAELVGRTCYETIHATEQPVAGCPHALLMADGEPHTDELHLECLRGDFQVSVYPFHDADGQLVGSVHVAHDITVRKQAEAEREKLLAELQDALAKIKTLRGLLPICAHCKKVRDDEGYWHSVETYVMDHSEAMFSHSICPECYRQFYADYEEDEKQR